MQPLTNKRYRREKFVSEPFLAEIRIVGFNFAPRGFATCDGQILPINQNQSLYSLLGTTFGGDGRTTFALPDLRGRVPMHRGDLSGSAGTRRIGQRGGSESHDLTAAELPAHGHSLPASGNQATSGDPEGNALAGRALFTPRSYSDSGTNATMRNGVIGSAGAGSPHNNMQPFAVVNYVIALQGLFPSRN